MSAFDLDTRHLLAREHVERLRHDAQRSSRRRRRWLWQRLRQELTLLSARRQAASLRTSS